MTPYTDKIIDTITKYLPKNENEWELVGFINKKKEIYTFGNDSKMIVSIHHSIAAYGKGLYRLCIKYLYRFADTITVLTSYERQQLTQNFKIPAQKVQIIPNGLNLDEIKEKQKNIQGGFP